MADLPYAWSHATCVDCGYHGDLRDFAAKRMERRGTPPREYPHEIGDVCAICFARSQAQEPQHAR